MKAIFMRVSLISFMLVLFIPNVTSAEFKTFIKEYTYQASEFDSKASSRTIALEQVKRLLLEELGTYLETSTEVKDFQLTKDQIKVFSAGIIQTIILNENWDGKQFWLKAKITANPDDVIKKINSLRNDKERTEDYEGANKKAEAALREVEKLRRELDLIKKDKTQIARYNQAVQDLSATDWYRKGIAALRAGNNNEAVVAYTKAIELDPRYVEAYIDRAFVYSRLGNDQRGLEDANKAIQLNPGNAKAYINRGVSYSRLGNPKQAIEDYSKAIGLNPKYALAYADRSSAYNKLGNYQQAIWDASKAIELDPKNALAYVNRGYAYAKIGKKENADNDYETAKKLGYVFKKVKKKTSWW